MICNLFKTTALPSADQIEQLHPDFNGTYIQEKLELFREIYNLTGDSLDVLTPTKIDSIH